MLERGFLNEWVAGKCFYTVFLGRRACKKAIGLVNMVAITRLDTWLHECWGYPYNQRSADSSELKAA